ncbi:MAG: helix-turn-helix domain-containing protein [Caulobacterales bacterium]
MLAANATVSEPSAPASPEEAFHAAPWLAAVPGSVLEGLADQAVMHRVPVGSRLFEQAETPNFAQFLIAGSVELLAVRGAVETLVETVRPIDMILPAAVLTRQPYLVRGKVLEEATVVLVSGEVFRAAVGQDHALCLAVLACQAAQFRRQMRKAKAIRLRSAEERAGCYLLRLAENAPGHTVKLPHEKRLIASQLGMTRETLSRALPVMARHGLRVEGDLLHVEDLAAARAAFPLDPLIDGAEAIVPLPLTRAQP